MNLRLPALFVASACAFACSSSDTPPTSGGAIFELQGADSSKAGTLGGCNDAGRKFQIATIGDDGKAKLIVDGADDARVKCAIDGSRFDLTVSNKNGSLGISGTYTGFKSSDATALVTFGSNNSYLSKDVPCTVTFSADAATGGVIGDHGNLFAHFSCPVLKNKTSDNACGIDVSGIQGAYFQFSNCTGF